MDYKSIHMELGFSLPKEIEIFEGIHGKLYAIVKSNIYEFLVVNTHAVPATSLAFKARAIINRSTDPSEKEIASEIFSLFSAANKDERKNEYDYFISFLSVNKIFDCIFQRNSALFPLIQSTPFR